MLLTVGVFPLAAGDGETDALLDLWESQLCSQAPHEVRDALHTMPWPLPDDPQATLTMHAVCAVEVEVQLDTDCTARSYSRTGWRWTLPYRAQVDPRNSYGIASTTVVSKFSTSANTWDNAVAADIFTSFVAGGSAANIRRQDFINQHGWKYVASSSTIAVTYTWSYSDGRAAESDAAYNTLFQWSAATGGVTGKMDLQNIATHELGHTFGLGHSSTTSTNSCLTMYPSGSTAETRKRSLGDGDILGIDAIY